MTENIYAKGIYFNPLKPETPDSVKAWKKGVVPIHIDNMIAYLESIREHANEKGYVYHDFVKNTNAQGEVFFSYKLNTWKPSGDVPAGKIQSVEDEWESLGTKDENPF